MVDDPGRDTAATPSDDATAPTDDAAKAAKAARKAAKREAKAAKQAAKARKAEDKQAAKRAKAAEQAAAKAAGKADAKAAKAARKAAKADAKAAKAARKAEKADRRAASEAEPSIDQQQATDAQVGAGVAEAIEAAEVVEAAAPDPTPTAATESLAEAAALVRRTREPAASRIVDRVDARPRRTRRTSVTPPGPVEVPSVESTPEPAPEPTPDLFEPDAQVEPEPEAEAEPEAQPEREPEAEAQAEPEPETQAEPEPEAQAEAEPQAEPEPEPEPEPEAQAEPEPEPEPEPEAQAEPEPEPEPEPEAQAEPEPEPEPEPEAQAEPEPEPEPEPEAQAEPWAQVEPERDAQAAPEPESPEPGAADAAETVEPVESAVALADAEPTAPSGAESPEPEPEPVEAPTIDAHEPELAAELAPLEPEPEPVAEAVEPEPAPEAHETLAAEVVAAVATEADTAGAASEATAQEPLVVEAVESVAIEADTAAAEPEADTVEAEPAGPLAVDATSAVESAVIGASIDIGANSIHLLVAAVAGHRIEPLLDESVFLGLGDRVARDGKIGPEARRDVVNALASYAATASRLGARELTIVGTEPIRRAFDATALVGEAEARADIALHVLDHDEEAMLTLLGVTRGRRVRNELLVVDIGGGSCEFVIAGPDRPVRSVGLSLGSARLTQDHIHSDPPTPAEVDALREIVRATLIDAPEANPQELVAVGGTASNLLRLLPATAIDRVLTRRRIAVALAMLTVERSVEAAERHALRPQRARILPAGAVIVDAILERYGVDRLQVSEEGIREGAVLAAATAGPSWRDRLPFLVAGWDQQPGPD